MGRTHREIFLILRRHAGQLDGAAAVRTRGRRRCSAGLVNLRRTRATRLPAVVRTSAPAGSPAATLGPVLGEGSGLPESCPPRRVELLLEVFTAAASTDPGRASTDPGRPRPASTPPAAVRSLALVPQCGYRGDPVPSGDVAVAPHSYARSPRKVQVQSIGSRASKNHPAKQIRHRQGFPCCSHSPLPRVPSPIPRRNRSVLPSLASRPLAAFPMWQAGRLPHRRFRGLLGVRSRYGPHGR